MLLLLRFCDVPVNHCTIGKISVNQQTECFSQYKIYMEAKQWPQLLMQLSQTYFINGGIITILLCTCKLVCVAGVQRGGRGKLNASAQRDRCPYERPTIALSSRSRRASRSHSTSPSLPFVRRPRRLHANKPPKPRFLMKILLFLHVLRRLGRLHEYMRVYNTLAVWRFKPFLSVGLRVHSYFIWRFTIQKIRAVSVLRKKRKLFAF